MNESVKHIKKHKKHKPDKKHNKKVSKDTLASKFNALEEVTKQEKADNIWPKATSSTEVFSSPNIPDILVTPQKKDAINNQAAPPNAKRKFSGDKTSHDGEPIQENIDYTEGSEERRIRTKSLPPPPSHSGANDFTSAPLPVNIADTAKEKAAKELLNQRFSIASKNDYVSALAPISFPTISKLGTKSLTKAPLNITLSEPISVVSHELEMPRQIVDHQYVNNSPRQRSKSVTESITPEEEPGYLKKLMNKFSNKGKKVNEEDDNLHSHSQPQIVSPIKPPVILKQNATPFNKSNLESKDIGLKSQKNLAPLPKHKMPDGAPGQKFIKLPPQVSVKPNEKNITPLKQDNKLKLPNQKLPLTTNLNKPGSKLGINPQNNSELEDVKQQLYLHREQLNQLLEKTNQNLAPQKLEIPKVSIANQNNSELENMKKLLVAQQKQLDQMMGQPQPYTHTDAMPNRHSNKGSSLNTILQLVEATERKPMNFNANLTGANDHHKEIHHHYIYDDDNNDH